MCQKCKHIYRTLEVLETSKPTAPKPKPEPPNLKRKPRKKTTWAAKNKVSYNPVDIDNLSDEEFEAAMFDGRIKFDEDEL